MYLDETIRHKNTNENVHFLAPTKFNISIREGIKDDIPIVFELIQELAQFENYSHELEIKQSELLENAFGENANVKFLVAENAQGIIGLSLFYIGFCAWKGKKLFLENIFIRNQYRSLGIGSTLFEATMRKSIQLKCNGMSWLVSNWNQKALNFYRKYKSDFDSNWVVAVLSNQEIARFVNK